MSIEVRNISKRFGSFTALDDVSLKVNDGELVALIGPSGSGKTSLLRIIAGLESADEGRGEILIHGQNILNHSARQRRIGFVFQHYALFRHMTVFENIAFGLRVRPRSTRPPKNDIARRVRELLRLVQLESFAARHPHQLSGGQRQRIALARALAVEPRVLLLDEPFGALDAKVRQELRQWLRRLHDEIGVTSLLVTHDQEEALEVADCIVVMNAGRIEQIGKPEAVFNQPRSAFVMEFLGRVNTFHGRVESGTAYIDTKDGPVAGRSSRFFVRPHHLEISRDSAGPASIRGTIADVWAAGPVVRVEVQSEQAGAIHVELPHSRYQQLAVKQGELVFVTPLEVKTFVEDYAI